MSFVQSEVSHSLLEHEAEAAVAADWSKWTAEIAVAATVRVSSASRFIKCDARQLSKSLPKDHYTTVITSPPYPNRMSYIRELRPYMYWLGYLEDGKAAGQLDWEAIGGTWGCATSNLSKWVPEAFPELANDDFCAVLAGIRQKSKLLATYVNKYFCDMVVHTRELYKVVKPGGSINYIIGNSKFYDVLVPVEEIFASLFTGAGFNDVGYRLVRKRSSKKELFEYVVYGVKPGGTQVRQAVHARLEEPSRQLALGLRMQEVTGEA